MVIHNSAVHPHQKIIKAITDQLREIFEESDQGIYVYRDDVHKACNRKFASWLGFESAEEWSALDDSFMETLVADESQAVLVSAFRRAMEDKIGSSFDITWKKKNGGSFKTRVILVPICYDRELLALHFITKL
jgi:PAS domain-containing protein